MICQDGGNVLCCDGCSNVAHARCVGIKKLKEEEDWLCDECKNKKKAPKKQAFQAKLTTNGKIQGKSATKEEKPARRGRPKMQKSPSPEPAPARGMSRRA